jgi:hypothetical protein
MSAFRLAIAIIAAFVVGLLARYLIAILFLAVRAKDQDHDATLTFTDDTVTVASPQATVSLPVSSVRAVRIGGGIAGYEGSAPAFFLPARTMNTSERSRIMGILGLQS